MRNATKNIFGVALLVLAAVYVAPQFFDVYRIKKRVEATVALAESVRDRIDQFYAQQKRLPNSQEETKFRVEGDGHFKSIAYDSQRKMVIVTMEIRDERFAIRAEEKDGALTWTCGNLNFRELDLPSRCRGTINLK